MPVKILMVCLGNICRSPLAEGILQSKLPENKFIVSSAGTIDWHVGNKPDSRSIETAKKHGIDISNQKANFFNSNDLEIYDYIFAMDRSNYNFIIKLAKNENQLSKVSLILNELFPNENVDVPDPYYGLQNGFDLVYEMLNESCTKIAEKLIKKHK